MLKYEVNSQKKKNKLQIASKKKLNEDGEEHWRLCRFKQDFKVIYTSRMDDFLTQRKCGSFKHYRVL